MTEIQTPDAQITAGALVVSTENVGTKRQRRPSVRLGDIGVDQSSESHRRSNKSQLKHQVLHTNKENHKSNLSSKSKTVLKLSGSEFDKTLDFDDKEGDLDCVAIGNWKVGDCKSKRRSSGITKRVRSNWVSKMDDDGDDVYKFSGGDGEFRGLDCSESPVKANSHVNSLDIEREGDDFRKGNSRARVLDGGVELDGPLQKNDQRNWDHCNGRRIGVMDWLIELGLLQYAPVFEIHEVDDEVLPMLTLDDLKEMGINAVGSRRKMYSSIQKLRKSF